MSRHSLRARLWELVFTCLLPLTVLAVLSLGMLYAQSRQFAALSNNISTVSTFQPDFEMEVEEQMFGYVSGAVSTLPTRTVQKVQTLAQSLLETTFDENGKTALERIDTNCKNLSAAISKIAAHTDSGYQKEAVDYYVYPIARRISQDMYSYLYYEAGELASMRELMHRLLIYDILLVIGITLIAIIYSLHRSRNITDGMLKPMTAMCERTREIAAGDLRPKPPIPAEDDTLAALGQALENVAAALLQNKEKIMQEQARNRSMELSLLRAQINPHFLYNTLYSIIWLIEAGKNTQAEAMVNHLSAYFRSFLSDGRDIIPLHEELVHIESYLEIQMVRYQDILRYSITVPPTLGKCRIPKMTLQPLVENAIYHGIKPLRRPGTVTVTGRMEENQVVLTVSDDGVGMSEDALRQLGTQPTGKSGGFGVYAVQERLRLTYGEDCMFRVDSSPKGTTVLIRIPYCPIEEPEGLLQEE